MSATKYEELRKDAYRGGVKQGENVIKYRDEMGMNEEYGADDWDNGPDFR
jgi:hypothetical protein